MLSCTLNLSLSVFLLKGGVTLSDPGIFAPSWVISQQPQDHRTSAPQGRKLRSGLYHSSKMRQMQRRKIIASLGGRIETTALKTALKVSYNWTKPPPGLKLLQEADPQPPNSPWPSHVSKNQEEANVILKKKEGFKRFILSDFKTCCKTAVIETVWPYPHAEACKSAESNQESKIQSLCSWSVSSSERKDLLPQMVLGHLDTNHKAGSLTSSSHPHKEEMDQISEIGN